MIPNKPQFEEDFKREIIFNSDPVKVEMSRYLAWCVALAVQHATKDPRFKGPTVELAADFARSLYRELATTESLQQLAAAGWEGQ